MPLSQINFRCYNLVKPYDFGYWWYRFCRPDANKAAGSEWVAGENAAETFCALAQPAFGIPVEVAVCSMKDQRSLKAALKDVQAVFHLAGSERLGSRSDLTGVDVEGTEALAQATAQTSVERIFFLSHLGADRFSAYPVLKAKALAEGHILSAVALIIRFFVQVRFLDLTINLRQHLQMH
jgi:hypothetical protein